MFDTIIEPFAGAAGYALRHHQKKVILVERDPILAGTWGYLIRVSPEEILALPDLMPGQDTSDLNLPQEAKWLIGWWLNKGANAPRRTPSSWMRGGTRDSSYWGGAVRHRIAGQLGLIRHWQVIEGDYSLAPDIEATWFIDPPYQNAGKYYRYGSGQLDFNVLGAWCRGRQGQVMVCENEGAFWLPFLPFRVSRSNQTQYGNRISREVLWENIRSDTDPGLLTWLPNKGLERQE